MEAKLFSVQTDSGILIYAFKFNENILVLPFGRSSKCLFIGINAAREIAVTAVGSLFASFLRDLRVMRQGDGFSLKQPVLIK